MTAKKHGIERTKEPALKEKAPVLTPKKRPPAGPANPTMRGCGDELAVRRVRQDKCTDLGKVEDEGVTF
ncbi:uncharacterized protein ARMOST_18578 [Armillaria ostoyae]|uniref:Uncharacterized protein n=1 Tax=Armillaria ostoyae TaxID=47428 RepID=A0A284S294_ARMOS|nr:uncharacterized protein ARMOST_18578 [Armillaria ostoyae]